MTNGRLLCRFQLVVFLFAVLSIPIVQLSAGERKATFGIFEVVDCDTKNAKSMTLRQGETPQKYCLAAKPIVDERDVKNANGNTDSFGRAFLELTLSKEAGARMEKATRGAISETGKLRTLAVVVNGKLVSVPRLTGPIVDQLEVYGGWTRGEVNEIVESLMRDKPKPAPPQART